MEIVNKAEETQIFRDETTQCHSYRASINHIKHTMICSDWFMLKSSDAVKF